VREDHEGASFPHKYAATEITEYTEIITYPESGTFGVFGGLIPSFPRKRESRPRGRSMIDFTKPGTLHIFQGDRGFHVSPWLGRLHSFRDRVQKM